MLRQHLAPLAYRLASLRQLPESRILGSQWLLSPTQLQQEQQQGQQQQLLNFFSSDAKPSATDGPAEQGNVSSSSSSAGTLDAVGDNPPSNSSSSSSGSSQASNPTAAAAEAGADIQQPPAAAAETKNEAAPASFYGARLMQSKRTSQSDRVKHGIIHINSTLNNTLLVLTDMDGLVKASATGGTAGYRNSGKSTPTAAEQAAREIAQKAYQLGYSSVAIKLKGRGKNKQFAAAALAAGGLTVTSLQDVTSIPHNGCRLPRKRRL